MSINGWVDKENVTYIAIIEWYSAMKKHEILTFVPTWMDLEGIRQSEVSQIKSNIVWSYSYVELKTKTS